MVSTYAEQDGAVLPVPVPSGNTAITDLLELLAGRDLLVAPHVASRLLEYLDGDVEAVAETVSVLSPDQRRGTRVLPDPLPLTPAVAEGFSDLALEPWERRLLLTAAVCVDDDTDVIRAVSGRSMDEIIAGEPGRRLVFVAGHFAFADLRLRQWSHESADLAARTKTHLELHRAYLSLGDDRRALWHLSLGTMQGEAALTRPLLELARTTAAEGDAERAFAVAREAMSHAGPADVEAARLTAGLAALRAGLLDDAADLLGTVVDAGGGGAGTVAVATAGLVVVSTLRSGAVPPVEPERIRPESASCEEWRDWGRLAALVAMLGAERDDPEESRRWLTAVSEADGECGADGALAGAAQTLAALLRPEGTTRVEGEPALRLILEALRRGLAGDSASGIRLLAGDEHLDATVPASRGFERSPVMRAYRGVVEALLRLWSGDVRAARETLVRTATRAPAGLPFAGMGVALARRLELAADGRCGAFSAALALSAPSALHADQLVERGIRAYLEGRFDEAAMQVGLWAERHAKGCPLGLPGLDEVGSVALHPLVEPRDITAARRIRIGIRSARAGSWGRDYREAAEGSRTIRSPFERGRVEALLGTTCVTRGDRGAGLRHLRAAQSLFAESGAGAWESAVASRLSRLGEAASTAAVPAVSTPPVSADPLAACHAAWAPLLTERELQVAMLVAEGRTNREISGRLHIALRTVEVHVGRLFGKFDVRSRAELTVLAHRTNQYA